MHFGEPSAHPAMEAVHTEPVQNEELPVASFIAVSMPLRQLDVSDAHTGVHGVGVQLDLMTA